LHSGSLKKGFMLRLALKPRAYSAPLSGNGASPPALPKLKGDRARMAGSELSHLVQNAIWADTV